MGSALDQAGERRIAEYAVRPVEAVAEVHGMAAEEIGMLGCKVGKDRLEHVRDHFGTPERASLGHCTKRANSLRRGARPRGANRCPD